MVESLQLFTERTRILKNSKQQIICCLKMIAKRIYASTILGIIFGLITGNIVSRNCCVDKGGNAGLSLLLGCLSAVGCSCVFYIIFTESQRNCFSGCCDNEDDNNTWWLILFLKSKNLLNSLLPMLSIFSSVWAFNCNKVPWSLQQFIQRIINAACFASNIHTLTAGNVTGS